MKKNFIVYALSLALISVNAVNAEDTIQTNSFKKQVNLKEIILEDEQVYEAAGNILISSEIPAVTDNTSAPDVSLENKDSAVEKEKRERFFSIFNLVGGVKKVNDATIGGVKKVGGAVGDGVGKAGGVVVDGVKCVDGAVGCGVDKCKDCLKGAVDKPMVKQWIDGDYATGKYFGERPTLEGHGVTINSSMLYSPFVKTGGGANGESSARGYSVFNLGVTVDTEKAGLWKGGTFFGLYQKKAGHGLSGVNPDGAMGDYFGFDGWDWNEINQISEYWYQQKFFNEKLRIKLGKQDSNTDFGYLNSGWDFMNSAFSVNPTTPLPSYPYQPFGFMAAISPKEWLTIKDGIYSKNSSPFNITEIEIKPTIKKMPGRYIIGAWEASDSNGMSAATGMNPDGTTYYNNFNRNFGCYAEFEQMVYKEKKDDKDDMQGLVVFGQFGIAPSNKNDLSRYVGGGLHYLGPIPKRDKDIVGIAVGSGNFAPRLGDVGSDYGSRVGSETVIEAFYRLQLNRWFYLQPDVQFIMNPGGMYPNSVAMGIRSVITF